MAKFFSNAHVFVFIFWKVKEVPGYEKYFFKWWYIQDLKGLEVKGLFSCLGLQIRFKRAYQIPINYSFLWLVEYYLNSSNNYLKIIIYLSLTFFL